MGTQRAEEFRTTRLVVRIMHWHSPIPTHTHLHTYGYTPTHAHLHVTAQPRTHAHAVREKREERRGGKERSNKQRLNIRVAN